MKRICSVRDMISLFLSAVYAMHCTRDENRVKPSYDSPLCIYRSPDIEVDTLAAI